VAAEIVEEIQVSVTPQEETRLKGSRTVKPEAYEAYLKGRHAIEQRTEESLRKGLAWLEDAVRLDPTLELAQVGVADAHNLMGFMTVLPPRDTFPRAQAAARRALEINPSSAEAFTSLAYPTLWHDWNHAEAERLFRKSIDLNPKYSQAHLWIANVLTLSDRPDEARTEAQMARILDPLSAVAIAFAGWFPYWHSRFDEAIRNFREAMQLIPGFGVGHYWMGLAGARAGHDREAMAALERSAEILGPTPQVVSALATAHALAGRPTEARTLMAELETQSAHRYVGAYYFAQVLVALGEREAAFKALEKAFDERVHWLAAIHIDPSLAALRGDPRFEAMAARVRR
jgi:Tfp pilus assembly protein PilF